MTRRRHSLGLKLFIFFLVAMTIFSAVGIMILYIRIPEQPNQDADTTGETTLSTTGEKTNSATTGADLPSSGTDLTATGGENNELQPTSGTTDSGATNGTQIKLNWGQTTPTDETGSIVTE